MPLEPLDLEAIRDRWVAIPAGDPTVVVELVADPYVDLDDIRPTIIALIEEVEHLRGGDRFDQAADQAIALTRE